MSLIMKETPSARIRLLGHAMDAVEHATRVEQMMFENRLSMLVDAARVAYGIEDQDSIFNNPNVDKSLLDAVQLVLAELRELKQARTMVISALDQMIRVIVLEEKSQ